MTEPLLLRNHLWVPKGCLSESAERFVKANLSVSLPQGELFPLWHPSPRHLLLPRTAFSLDEASRLFHAPVQEDRLLAYESVPYLSSITLDSRLVNGQVVPTGLLVQAKALRSMEEAELGGSVELYCGAGKTPLSLEYIARSGKPAVVLVDNEVLLDQWVSAASRFLSGPAGWLKKAKKKDGYESGSLVVTTYQSAVAMVRSAPPREVLARFATAIFDEAHHVSAPYFSQAAEMFEGKRIALTATPNRADGLERIQQLHIGPQLYRNLRAPLHPEALFLKVPGPSLQLANKFDPLGSQEQEFARIAGMLGRSSERREALASTIHSLLEEGRRVLVLSASVDALINLMATCMGEPPVPPDVPRVRHARNLLEQVKKRSLSIGLVIGELNPSERGVSKQLTFANRKFGREGYDDEKLDTVLLCEPVRDAGLIQQMLGRILRPYTNKLSPLFVVAVDRNIHAFQVLASHMRSLFQTWPEEKGGRIHFKEKTWQSPS